MINDGINNIPENNVVIFKSPLENNTILKNETIDNIIQKPSNKRDWFTSHFYRCLPLAIGNSYGFVIKSEFDFGFEWNGGNDPKDVSLFFDNNDNLDEKHPRIESHFGHGIITINTPFTLRTPPGVNLMTINPPNYIIPNITAMTGVIETDNIRRNFTFNLKIQMPQIRVFIKKDTPIAAFIPIPRYFADSFVLKNAEDIFDKDLIREERSSFMKSSYKRVEAQQNNKFGLDRDYYSGKDAEGNIFKDHQKP